MKALLQSLLALLALSLLVAAPARAQQAEWDNVARIVVIGDLEGDYEKFVDMLRTAELIDARSAWSGGAAHLVQLGDVPDRGPNSRAIMDLIRRLEPQAQRAGGRVHALIGNHEAMNVEGDLRYVHPGEYAAFADNGSRRRRNAFYQQTLAYLRATPPPAGIPAFDEAFRAQWEREHPLGFVEHRRAWAPGGAYGGWVAGHQTAIRVNDTLFVHGGIGPAYLAADRGVMNEAVRAALRGRPLAPYAGILTDQDGPLWYRGLATHPEDAERPHLEALLARHGVSRIVVGHSKVAPSVFPRFSGRVLIADIAVRRGHSDPRAFLVFESGTPITIHRGRRVPLAAATSAERCSYLSQIAALDPADGPMSAFIALHCANDAAGAGALDAPP